MGNFLKCLFIFAIIAACLWAVAALVQFAATLAAMIVGLIVLVVYVVIPFAVLFVVVKFIKFAWGK